MKKILIVLLLCCPLGFAQQSTYEFNPGLTKVEFKLETGLHTVHGEFKLKRGIVRYDPVTGKASGEIVIDATSGDSKSESRDHRMHKGVLESAKYTDIVFVPDRMEGRIAAEGESEVKLHGMMTLLGKEHEMTLPAKVQPSKDGLSISTHFVVPYIEWGLKNPSTFVLRVSHDVQIAIEATVGAVR
jgi:polyisoprenoid-binding protein YceI